MENKYFDTDTTPLRGATSSYSTGHICFIGPSNGSEKIRTAFNTLETEAYSALITDLGDIKKGHESDILAILNELAQEKNIPIYAASEDLTSSMTSEFWDHYLRPVVVTNRPLSNQDDLSYLGLQRHMYTDEFEIDSTKQLRLGVLRNNIESAEVVLRQADILFIDLNVLRLADNLGSNRSQVAGLMIEELCMIAKYAGAAHQIKGIIINGYDENADQYGMMAKSVGLLLYYILDGLEIRSRELNQKETIQRYTVISGEDSQELVFVEDKRSGRWWVEMYSEVAEEVVQLACSEKDYIDACNNVISDRITNLATNI